MILSLALWMACTGSPPPAEPAPTEPDPVVDTEPEPEPEAAVGLPDVAWAPPEREQASQAAVPTTPAIDAARASLLAVVEGHARDPGNPWAVGHALLALGPEATLSNGQPAVDHLFAEYAQTVDIEGETALVFPRSRGDIRIEPHSDLLLKAFTEIGLKPDRKVTVQGAEHELGQLYRHSMRRAWVQGSRVGFDDHDDTAWALQALATWAPKDQTWTADGGHAMTMDGFTSSVVAKLHEENTPLHLAMKQDRSVQKRGQHIFGYTCGGAHLFQGAAYAVGRGFGTDQDRATVVAEIPLLFWRLRDELAQIDAAIRIEPKLSPLFVEQRLKFLGHFLESTHKASAMGLWQPDEAQKAELAFALDQLVSTVDILQRMGLFDKLAGLREGQEQFYLDVVGDSAHALRGLDLATGKGTVLY